MRPIFHLTAPKGLINDPNGFTHYKNKYFVFFQWNPYGLDHSNKHWGLMTSHDFIHRTEASIALRPDKKYDKDGCYSGSARIIEDRLYLIYTGNVRNGQDRQSYQCLAYEQDNFFVKCGPILNNPAQGYTSHFRDPFYFKVNNRNFFMIGARDLQDKGKILIYEWDNIENPSLMGELISNINLDAYMIECPNIIFGNNDILIYSPQGIKRQEFKYQNIYHSIAAIGKLDLENLRFDADTFDELDYGFDFYAPQVLADKNLLIAWMGLPEQEEVDPSETHGWKHCLTMVRKLSVEDGKLKQRPFDSYKKLRKKEIKVKVNEKIYSKFGEIRLKFKLDKDPYIKVKLFASNNYYTILTYKDGILSLDRNKSMGLYGVRKLNLGNIDKLDLQIFMDQSTIEIFINDGSYVMSARTYNPDNAYFELIDVANAINEKYSFYEFEV